MTGEEFKNTAEKIGWNNKELSKRLGKSEVMISRYIHDKAPIPISIEKLLLLYLERSNEK